MLGGVEVLTAQTSDRWVQNGAEGNRLSCPSLPSTSQLPLHTVSSPAPPSAAVAASRVGDTLILLVFQGEKKSCLPVVNFGISTDCIILLMLMKALRMCTKSWTHLKLGVAPIVGGLQGVFSSVALCFFICLSLLLSSWPGPILIVSSCRSLPRLERFHQIQALREKFHSGELSLEQLDRHQIKHHHCEILTHCVID